MPFSSRVLWYPMLVVLALDEIAEVPLAAAMILGRLLVSDRPPYPVADRDDVDEA
jgi:hypothetical protein